MKREGTGAEADRVGVGAAVRRAKTVVAAVRDEITSVVKGPAGTDLDDVHGRVLAACGVTLAATTALVEAAEQTEVVRRKFLGALFTCLQ